METATETMAAVPVPAYEEAMDWGLDEPEEDLAPQEQKQSTTAPGDETEESGLHDATENGGGAVREAPQKETIRALYFVRIPKRDFDDRSVELAQHQFDMRLSTSKIVQENRRMKKFDKSEARSNIYKQLEALKAANVNVNEKMAELDPMRAVNMQRRTARSALMESKRQLEATSEEELDRMMKRLEYELEHETLTLKQEKEHIAQLKRLKQQRPKVQSYAIQSRDFETKNTMNEAIKGDQEQLEKELKIYIDERTECRRVLVELKAVEADIDRELSKIDEEYGAAVQIKNRAFEELKAAKAERRERMADFGDNRSFSRRVRALVASGDVLSAKDLCEQQTDQMMKKLKDDKEYREEYLRLWEKQRNPSTFFVPDDVSADKVKPKDTPKSKNFVSMHEGVQPEPGQTLAQAVVARVMREANGEQPESAPAKTLLLEARNKPQKHITQDNKVKPSAEAAKKKSTAAPGPKSSVTDFELPEVIVREVLNKKPENKKAVSSPKKNAGNLKLHRKEQAEKKRLKKLEEKRLKEKQEKATKELANQEARDKQFKQMQAKALAAEKAEEKTKERPKETVRTRAAVIPDPIIRNKKGSRPRMKPKSPTQSLMAWVTKNSAQLSVLGAGFVLVLIALYMLVA